MSVGTVWWTNYPTGQTVELPLDSLWKKTPIFTSENLVFSRDFPVTVCLESARKMWGTVKTSRLEVLDDHMNDSNRKKIVLITQTIIKKYNRAIKNELESAEYFKDLSRVPTHEQLALWEAENLDAEVRRTEWPAVMNVMSSRINKAPTLAEKRLHLLKEPERGVAGETAWLMASLKLEEQQ
ncbi:hypothetical protein BYT27DRAFT_7216293 [Phlegmacium glaucopus]|nr:hypothetical protein BYT27DRAFT_7216293 [Phlegmacium glaucopus]